MLSTLHTGPRRLLRLLLPATLLGLLLVTGQTGTASGLGRPAVEPAALVRSPARAPLFTPSPYPPTITPSPTTTPACGPAWRSSPSPAGTNHLSDIKAVALDDVWTVGSSLPGSPAPLIEHWGGSAWSVVPSDPPPGADFSNLFALAPLAANDVWAIGSSGFFFGSLASGTLTEHWDGVAWTVVPSPNVGDRYNELVAASALSTNDVWAAGTSYILSDMALHSLIRTLGR